MSVVPVIETEYETITKLFQLAEKIRDRDIGAVNIGLGEVRRQLDELEAAYLNEGLFTSEA